MQSESDGPPDPATTGDQAPDERLGSTEILSAAALPPVTRVAEVLHHTARKLAVQPAVALPGSYLAYTDEQGEQQLLPIGPDTLRLGRSSSADIQLEDIRVSRKHAIISRQADAIRILDDGSSTGTFVNDEKVVTAELKDGDVIKLGPVEFKFVVVR